MGENSFASAAVADDVPGPARPAAVRTSKWDTHPEVTVNRTANPYARGCASREVLDRIGDRWSVLVVLDLGHGVRRFGQLERRLEGVSQKMLTQTLRNLERDGLVSRHVHAVVPPRVDYALTELGEELLDVVTRLEAWASGHVGDVARARAAFDQRY